MKRFLAALICTAPFVIAPSVVAQPRPKARPKRLSVLDYYFLLPYVGLEAQGMPQKERRQQRAEALKAKYKPIIDLRHDYLQVDPDSSPTAEIAVFRFNGADIVAHSEPDYHSDYNSFALYRLQNGKMRDVTEKILPVAPLTALYLYELPRIGTTIQVYRFDLPTQSRKLAFNLQWRRGHFVKVNIQSVSRKTGR